MTEAIRTEVEFLAPPEASAAPATLGDLLKIRDREDGNKAAYAFLQDGERETASLTWSEIARAARAFAARLQAACGASHSSGGGNGASGLSRGAVGARVLLAHPPGLEFVIAFLGCMAAGAVAVPCAPPGGRRTRPRFQVLARDAAPAVVVTSGAMQPALREALAAIPELDAARWLNVEIDGTEAGRWRDPGLGGDALALLQYTSGSTASPRGILLTHAHLLHNLRMIRDAFEQSPESVVVGWLPLYHDMGLIGNMLSPLHVGSRCVLMPPPAFLQRPARWLEAITKYRGTTSGAPDFAYALCAARIGDEERAPLDLSSWKTAFNGSEPIRPETLERFAEAFAPRGFRPEAFLPCYGLAEATLLVSGAQRRSPPRVLPDPGESGRPRVSCGPPAAGLGVLVVDPERGAPVPDGQIGEIWVTGPSVGLGYWRREEDTRATFHARPAGATDPDAARCLRTGDLGFLDRGEVVVTGRLKDLIILRGRNHYPSDIEATVRSVSPSLPPGGGAAFGIEIEGEERLVVVHELYRGAREDRNALIDRIRGAVAEAHEVQPYAVLLLRPGRLPRTTSGKVRRRACADAFVEGSLDPVAWSVLGRARVEAAPALRRDALATAAGAVERRERIEEYLSGLVGAATGCAPGRSDRSRTLAAIGLDSLGAVTIQHAIERDLGSLLEVSELLGEATVRSIAALLETRWDAKHAEAGPPGGVAHPGAARRAASVDPARPSHGQRSLWLQHRMAPGSGAYNVPFVARLGGSVDVEALARAFAALVERHESLRMTFDSSGGELRAHVRGAASPLQRVDARGWAPGELSRWIEAETRRGFDLERGPLLRARLLNEGEGRHILVLVIHHLAVDFWSLAILLDDLAILYAAERRGAAAGLPPVVSRYAEFADWQEELVRGPAGRALEGCWRSRLAGAPAGLDLPTDRPRAPSLGFAGDRLRFELGADLSQAVRDLAAGEGVTPFAVLLAGFGALLGRWSGQEDLVLGSPTAARPSSRFADVVGYCTNVVPIRLDLGADPTFRQLLSHARERITEALELQHLPLPVLVERLNPSREAGRAPLFQVVFAFERAHRLTEIDLAPFALGAAGGPIRVGELELEPLACHAGGAPFEITLLAVDSGGGFRACIDYRTELFERGTMERLARRLVRVLEAAVREPSARTSELPLLEESERTLVLERWSRTETPCLRDRCVHELVEEQVRLRPGAEAVRDASGSLTYAELHRRAEAVARELSMRGLEAEERVGVLLGRSSWAIAALLGVLQAGGAYVPLEESDPDERLRWIVEDCGIRVVVASGALAARARDWGAGVVDAEAAEIHAGERRPVRVDPEQLAYVMHTSGSTGTPKGVMVPHRAIVRLVAGDFVRFGPEETFLGFAPLGFDASTLEIWGPLAHGGRLALAPPGAASLDALGAFLGASEVTTAWLTAGLFHLMVEERISDLRGVRQLLAGGDVLSPAHVRRALEALPGVRLVNGYGPTEGTTFTCCHAMSAPDEVLDPVPIGRPIAGTRVMILDRWMRPAPPGVPGELWIGGYGLARGYLGAPALTAERFAPDPFGPPGERIYRTGDRARWRADGTIEFLGRLDDQVKVRGFRVEPGEVEAAILSHPAVSAAAVVARADGVSGAWLVAWLVPRDGSPRSDDLRAYLRARLPEHLVPSRCVWVDALPLTRNGKVDRRALARRPLPRPERVDRHALDGGTGDGPVARAGEPAVPATGLEGLISELWREALGLEQVDLDENFFDLGAHSLTLAKVHARLVERLGRPVPIVDLFHHPTVRALAAHLRGEGDGSSTLADARRRGAARRAAAASRREGGNG